MKKILLTGASGTVGREVLLQLCQPGVEAEITVFDRKTKESEKFLKKFNKKCDIIYGDISVREDISRACTGKDIVIHLAAVIPPLADKNPDLAEAVNIRGTRNLIESIEAQSPDAFLIYSSSISVYGDRNKNPYISTEDELAPSDRDEYARTKIEAEKIIKSSDLDWTIFRLTAIMGMGNHKPSALMFHMPLDTCMEIATPGDTGRAFVNALDHLPELKGNIYNLGGGSDCRISYRDFLSRSFRIMGLGHLDFSPDAFAGRNFHCGYYTDGDKIEEILRFRKDTIEDYFRDLKKSVSPGKRIAATLFRGLIRKSLESKSEPLAARRTNNNTDIQHYF
jgi:nucleoside-diphosphate-sugar epimerase